MGTMDSIQNLAPELPAETCYALAAAMGMEHLGNLFTFLDQRLGELVMFDPAAKVKEATLREAIRAGEKVCRLFVQDGQAMGIDNNDMRELWPRLVDMAIVRPPQQP